MMTRRPATRPQAAIELLVAATHHDDGTVDLEVEPTVELVHDLAQVAGIAIAESREARRILHKIADDYGVDHPPDDVEEETL